MTTPQWLIKHSVFNAITNYAKNKDITDVILSNGIISPEQAKFEVFDIRFKGNMASCPECASFQNWETKVGNYKCHNNHAFSVYSSTYIHGTKLDFYTWWRFAFLIGVLKISNTSYISKDLNITQKSSWAMLDSLKVALTELKNIEFKTGHDYCAHFNNTNEVLNILLSLTIENQEAQRQSVIKMEQ